MYNYISPYIARYLQNAEIILEIESNMVKSSKNSTLRVFFENMLSDDNYQKLQIKKIESQIENTNSKINIPPLKPISSHFEGIKYLINLKKDIISVYKYLNSVKLPKDINISFASLIKIQNSHIDSLLNLNTSLKSRSYCSGIAIDLVKAYLNMHEAAKNLYSSEKCEDDRHKKRELKMIYDLLQKNCNELVKSIEDCVKCTISIHHLTMEDTIWKLSSKYTCSPYDILELNSITNPYTFSERQILLIPLSHSNS